MDARVPTQDRGRLFEALSVAGVVLVALLRHVSELRRPFFADDFFFLEQVRNRNLFDALSSPDPLRNFFRPVGRQLYFWTLGRLGGEQAWVFRAANVALFAFALLLLYRIVRSRVGPAGSIAAIAFFGMHYAADVPLLWISGGQDLLALVFALGSLALLDSQRSWLAAALFALGVLSKETVVLTPIIGCVLARGTGITWRTSFQRTAPLFAILIAWALLFALHQPGTSSPLTFTVGALPVAALHLLQVAASAEFRASGSAIEHWRATGVAIGVFAGLALWFVSLPARDSESSKIDSLRSRRSNVLAGSAWALCGTLPIALVVPIWSAYFYLFALCGVALIIGTVVESIRGTVAIVGITILVALSANASRLDEFATNRELWTSQSHVNRHYLERAMTRIATYLEELRAARPTLPRNSTLFFAEVPVSLGWQVGDGPLVRWAYRDSSLRSYFITDFSRARAARGPMFFFVAEGDSLVDHSSDPMLLPSFAYSMLLSDRPRQAVEALELVDPDQPLPDEFRYWRIWARWAAGDSIAAKADLSALGLALERQVPSNAPQRIREAGSDTTLLVREMTAIRREAGLSPWIHARLAAVCLAVPVRSREGTVEAFAFRTLQPDDPDAWRKWASAQLAAGRYEPALTSLEKYLELRGDSAHADVEVQLVVRNLRRVLHGDIAQAGLRR